MKCIGSGDSFTTRKDRQWTLEETDLVDRHHSRTNSEKDTVKISLNWIESVYWSNLIKACERQACLCLESSDEKYPRHAQINDELNTQTFFFFFSLYRLLFFCWIFFLRSLHVGTQLSTARQLAYARIRAMCAWRLREERRKRRERKMCGRNTQTLLEDEILESDCLFVIQSDCSVHSHWRGYSFDHCTPTQ